MEEWGHGIQFLVPEVLAAFEFSQNFLFTDYSILLNRNIFYLEKHKVKQKDSIHINWKRGENENTDCESLLSTQMCLHSHRNPPDQLQRLDQIWV